MNRIKKAFEKAKEGNTKIVSIFVTAGYPKKESTVDLLLKLEESGADFVELGIPFSDPMADGPTIQNSSQVALANGMTPRLVLEQVRSLREKSELPVILMGYLNPIAKYGFGDFLLDAREAGADGFIIPDLIPEEISSFQDSLPGESLPLNLLISPNTPVERMRLVDQLTDSFVYCVSQTGVTGARDGVSAELVAFLGRARETLTHPFLVGFGISNPADAAEIAGYSDGVIIGSSILNLMSQSQSDQEMLGAAGKFVREINSAVKGV